MPAWNVAPAGSVRNSPSTVSGKRPTCALFVASITCSEDIARSAESDAAPAPVAHCEPACSACASGTARRLPSSAPLSPIAAEIRSRESGDAMWPLTESEPADSPAIVIFDGSPPNAAAFSRTHRSAAFWSRKP